MQAFESKKLKILNTRTIIILIISFRNIISCLYHSKKKKIISCLWLSVSMFQTSIVTTRRMLERLAVHYASQRMAWKLLKGTCLT